MKVYEGVSITQSSRLVFEDIKSYQNFFNYLSQKSPEDFKLWEESISYNSLSSSGYDGSVMLPSLSKIFNHQGEYQVGHEIIWLHENTEYIIKNGSEVLLADVKLAVANGDAVKNDYVETFILSSISFTDSSESETLKDAEAINARPVPTYSLRSGSGQIITNNTLLNYGPNRMGNNPHYLPSSASQGYSVGGTNFKLEITHAVYKDYLGMGVEVGLGLYYRHRKGWRPAGEITIKNMDVFISGEQGADWWTGFDYLNDTFQERIRGNVRSSGASFGGIYYVTRNYKFLTIHGDYSIVVDHSDPAYNGQNLIVDNYTAYYENVY